VNALKKGIGLGLLALIPLTSFAESDYATCMRMAQLLGDSSATLLSDQDSGRRYRNYGSYGGYISVNNYSSSYYGGGSYYSYLGSTYGMSGLYFSSASSAWFDGENNRVLQMSRSCRHLVKHKPPAFRVVGVKSPAYRAATNVTGRPAAASENPK
jgi:hypothetical protein